jgi:hypothetical protein
VWRVARLNCRESDDDDDDDDDEDVIWAAKVCVWGVGIIVIYLLPLVFGMCDDIIIYVKLYY